jgi:outer membrane receptor protein involved in Fe transport
MGTVIVSPGAQLLNEVKVTGQAALVENRIDKLVYNAEKDITSAGGNATDILQKVPLVAVDINGNVSLRGDQNVRVLINGKPSGAMSASLSDVLKTIPADQIKSVEVITSPSAKYDAEGSGGIINIITKQKNISGVSGSVSGGVGLRQNNGNINFNYNHNRLSFAANIGGNLTWPQTTVNDFLQEFKQRDTTNHNISKSRMKRHGLMGSATLGYDFNNFNSLSSTIRISGGGFDLDGSSMDSVFNRARTVLITPYIGKNINNNSLFSFDWNIDYTHKFKKEGHELTFSTQWTHSDINTDYFTYFTAVNPSQKGSNDSKGNEYTFQLDYTLPISKLLKLEAGGKTIVRRINSDYNIYNPGGTATENPADYTDFDEVSSNLYNYHQNVYAGYSVLNFTLPKDYALLIGGRIEHTAITGLPTNTLQPGLKEFTQDYDTFIPSFTVQKKLTQTQTMKLSYSKRIQRPSLQFLNPFINRSNIQNQTVGNPTLSPEVSQTIELNYNTFIKSSVINVSVYYKNTKGLIEGIATPIQDIINGEEVTATRTLYQNIGSNKSWGSSLYGSVNPIKRLTLRASISAYTYKPDPTGLFVQDRSKNGTYIMYNMFASGSLDMGKNLVAEIFTIQNSPRYTIQGKNPTFGFIAMGVKKQFMDKRLSLGLTTFSPFSNTRNFDQDIESGAFKQSSHSKVPFRSFGISFSYSFGKLSFSNPQQKKKGVNNDDLKQDDQGGGMGGGGSR